MASIRMNRVAIRAALTVAGFVVGATSQTQPTKDQFKTTVLMSKLNDPMQIVFSPEGKLYELSKDGTISMMTLGSTTVTQAAKVPVSNIREDGLQSMVFDPKFTTNRRAYLLFGEVTPKQAMVLARYSVLANGNIDLTTRQDILTVTETITSSDEHTTGCLAFDTTGNLYIGLADNTNGMFAGANVANNVVGTSPRDPRHPNLDSQRSAANSNDLRGKILRIHPEDNGTYTIPTGNLFAKTDSTLPEIFAMGIRHPFRITVDPKTNWVYWAEPGPNAPADMAGIGPRGYDVVQYARTPGNYGYPYCRGNNFCYNQYDFATGTSGAVYDPNNLVNSSTNNTGIHKLPPARPALVWYPYDATGTAWTVFGKGNSNAAMSGFVYRFNPSLVSTTKLPRYYDQHLFIFDFQRSLVHAVQLNDTGGVTKVERFWDPTYPGDPIANTIDLKQGPDGSLYFLNWADNGAYHDNLSAGDLVRLDYTGPADPIMPTFGRADAKGFQLIHALPGQKIFVPAEAIGAVFYNLRGERVWSVSWAANPGIITLPSNLHGVLRMKVRFH